MKTIAAVFSIVFIVAFTDSGAQNRYTYFSPAHNIPVFTKQFDSKIAANFATDGGNESYSGKDSSEREKSSSDGFDIQGGLALTNRIALQLGYYYRREHGTAMSKTDFADSRIISKYKIIEFGLGYYTPLDKKQHMFFQLYTGGGFGKTTIRESGMDTGLHAYSRSYDANITKMFLEPSLSFRTKIAFTGSVFTRATIAKFSRIRSNYTKRESQNLNLDSLDRYSVLFIEPGIIGSLGFRRLPGIRIEVQIAAAAMTRGSFIKYQPINMAIGLYLDLPKLIKWQKYQPFKW
ncbi:MAG: hypothetical protein QM737_11345 [Ferruginibacter sp.]